MNKTSVFCFVALLAVGTALAAAPAPQNQVQVDPALAAAIFAPADQPILMSSCSVSVDCYCGGNYVTTLSCTGTVCSHGPASITCDGHRYSCLSIDCNPQAP